MTTGRDDDALHWDGDDDPTLDVGAASDAPEPTPAAPEPVLDAPEPVPAALPDGFTAVGKGAEHVGHIEKDGTVVMPGDRVPMGSAALVALGILGGVYLIYTIGWIVAGERLRVPARLLVSDWAYVPAFWTAVLAPVLWFTTCFVATRDSATWVRMTWLAAGIVLLIPWPLVMVGAVGR